jgi:hypothetical protein
MGDKLDKFHEFKHGAFKIKIIDPYTKHVTWELYQHGKRIEAGEHTNAHDAYNMAMAAMDKHDEMWDAFDQGSGQ